MDWLPFDLHPEYPAAGIPRAQLQARYGEEAHERLKAQFEAAGLPYNPPPERIPRTLDALRLTELARDNGLHAPMHDRLMDAYWNEAADLGNAGVLRSLADEVGLAADDVAEVLSSDRYADRVRWSTEQASSIGVNGIPAYLLDRRLLVLGAQPRPAFEQAFAQLGS